MIDFSNDLVLASSSWPRPLTFIPSRFAAGFTADSTTLCGVARWGALRFELMTRLLTIHPARRRVAAGLSFPKQSR
jgi:hypothetical protein